MVQLDVKMSYRCSGCSGRLVIGCGIEENKSDSLDLAPIAGCEDITDKQIDRPIDRRSTSRNLWHVVDGVNYAVLVGVVKTKLDGRSSWSIIFTSTLYVRIAYHDAQTNILHDH